MADFRQMIDDSIRNAYDKGREELILADVGSIYEVKLSCGMVGMNTAELVSKAQLALLDMFKESASKWFKGWTLTAAGFGDVSFPHAEPFPWEAILVFVKGGGSDHGPVEWNPRPDDPSEPSYADLKFQQEAATHPGLSSGDRVQIEAEKLPAQANQKLRKSH